MNEFFGQKLLAWYKINARSLPWRGHADPYAVWVSEIMCQQTRIDTVIPYFLNWMRRFPSIKALAESDEQEVLNAWEGLGYYTRARSLLKAARQLNEAGLTQLPQSRTELEKLPGLGRYSAAAIASIAFGQNEAVLDGNVKRVLSRVFNMEVVADTPAGEKLFWQKAEECLPLGHAGDYNQAVMDLGATICTPTNPDCQRCPLNEECEANKLGLQNQRPLMTEKKPIPHWLVVAAVIERDGKVLIARRPSQGLLGGLWEFPGGKVEAGEAMPEALRREIREELATEINVGSEIGSYKHAYTHFKVTLHAFYASLEGKEPTAIEASEIRWVTAAKLNDYPMGKLDRMISNDLT